MFGAILNAGDLVLGVGWLELPAWYAESLCKGAGHKYIKRVPRAGGGWRYFYHVGHGGGVANEDHFVAGAAFKHDGGHYHITSTTAGAGGHDLAIKHDETGKEQTVSKNDLREMVAGHHAPAVKAAADKVRTDWSHAVANGASAKQKAKIKARAESLGVGLREGTAHLKPDGTPWNAETGKNAGGAPKAPEPAPPLRQTFREPGPHEAEALKAIPSQYHRDYTEKSTANLRESARQGRKAGAEPMTLGGQRKESWMIEQSHTMAKLNDAIADARERDESPPKKSGTVEDHAALLRGVDEFGLTGPRMQAIRAKHAPGTAEFTAAVKAMKVDKAQWAAKFDALTPAERQAAEAHNTKAQSDASRAKALEADKVKRGLVTEPKKPERTRDSTPSRQDHLAAHENAAAWHADQAKTADDKHDDDTGRTSKRWHEESAVKHRAAAESWKDEIKGGMAAIESDTLYNSNAAWGHSDRAKGKDTKDAQQKELKDRDDRLKSALGKHREPQKPDHRDTARRMADQAMAQAAHAHADKLGPGLASAELRQSANLLHGASNAFGDRVSVTDMAKTRKQVVEAMKSAAGRR